MRGFSVIEILIVVAIFAVIASIGAAPFVFFKKARALDAAVQESVSALLEARARTLSSRNASQYGVHFNADSATLFSGAVFNPNASDNEEKIFAPLVLISAISLEGGGSDVIFKRLTGETDFYGTVTFRLTAGGARERTLRIGKTGTVNIE